MELKFDPERPHHYIIGVGVRTMRSKDPGKLYLKYGPLHFTNDDIARVRDAKVLSEDKLFKTTGAEALKINDVSDIVYGLNTMKLAVQANNCSLHHFSSSNEFSEEDLEVFVNAANVSEDIKQKLMDAKI